MVVKNATRSEKRVSTLPLGVEARPDDSGAVGPRGNPTREARWGREPATGLGSVHRPRKPTPTPTEGP